MSRRVGEVGGAGEKGRIQSDSRKDAKGAKEEKKEIKLCVLGLLGG